MKTTVEKQIKKHYTVACDLAIMEVERMARRILSENPDLDHFTMGMGRWLFSLTIGELDRLGMMATEGNTIIHEEDVRFKELSNFISDWDDLLKITGEPMRITKTGERKSQW